MKGEKNGKTSKKFKTKERLGNRFFHLEGVTRRGFTGPKGFLRSPGPPLGRRGVCGGQDLVHPRQVFTLVVWWFFVIEKKKVLATGPPECLFCENCECEQISISVDLTGGTKKKRNRKTEPVFFHRKPPEGGGTGANPPLGDPRPPMRTGTFAKPPPPRRGHPPPVGTHNPRHIKNRS